MELLSPAGNIAAAYAAFKGGADAIYIGGKRFSARASADNFSDEEIEEITDFAHSIGRKVYVTLNTLLFQDEFFDAVDFAKFLYQIDIDGVIIQDLGLAHYLHKTIPDLPLNASTQLNCHNIEQAKALVKIGFKRIVLARESPLDFVKQVKNLGVEVEVFGHGALCVSYSGNCLLSSFIGNRSGNRGRCAQPCRLRYDLYEDGKPIEESIFSISTKDLMTIDYLPKFIECGVDSLKIEGRLKSLEYIFAVSKAYRHAIDAAKNNKKPDSIESEKVDLTKIFNRQFTKGYILNASQFDVLNFETSSHQGEVIGKVISAYKNRISIKLFGKLHRLDGIRFNNKEQFGLTVEKMFLNTEPIEEGFKRDIIEIVGIDDPKRFIGTQVIKTKDYLLLKKIESEMLKDLKVNIFGEFIAKINEPISLTITYQEKTINVTGEIAEKAKTTGTSKERIKEQLNKSGIYPYQLSNLSIICDDVFIPISSLNKLRNDAFEALKNSFIRRNIPKMKKYQNLNNLPKNLCNSSIIFLNNDVDYHIVPDEISIFKSNNTNNVYEDRVTANKSFNNKNEIVHFIIQKRHCDYLIASQYCNITNSYALDCFYSLGFNQCILSIELEKNDINNLITDYKNRYNSIPSIGLLLYGKLDMMIMHSCPIGTHFKNESIHCQRCHLKNYELRDRTGAKYRLIGDASCNIRMLNDKPIFLLDKEAELRDLGIQNFYLLFTDEDKEKVIDIIDHYMNKDGLFSKSQYTRGHYLERPL